MSYIKIYAHFVWSTKHRIPFLSDEIRHDVFAHIRENARQKEIFLDCINGYTDHVHCLISLNPKLSLSDTVRLLKGESTHWINQNGLTSEKFGWQDQYWAVGVGDDKLDIVRNYIFKQEQHHAKVSFQTEYDKLLKRYGFVAEG